jgi:hypothetical protein
VEQGTVAHDRASTAQLLALLGEVLARKLYRRAGYPSMFAWCIAEFRMSEDIACRRIRTAHAARRFPLIYEAIADGRLHVSGVSLLRGYLNQANGEELLNEAMGKSRREIERLIACRFPRKDVQTQIVPLPPALIATPIITPPQPGETDCRDLPAPVRVDVSTGTASSLPMAAPIPTPEPYPRVTPLAPERFALQVTIGQGTHDKLRRVQELLGHQVAAGDLAEVLDRALETLLRELEKRKFAATSKPRSSPKPLKTDTRYIPAEVKRAVRARDQDQCTFVSESGQRCPAREGLEFDHIEAFARGGKTTVGNLRLRCDAHNQFEAERTFGVEFMKHKMELAQRDRTRALP